MPKQKRPGPDLDNRPQDKVAVYLDGATRRAVLLQIMGDTVRVHFADDGSEQELPATALVRNFSDAARKANSKRTRTPADAARAGWRTRSKRNVGRPAAARKMTSATIRVFEDSWSLLGQAAEAGLIVSRQELINTMLDGLCAMLWPQLASLQAQQIVDDAGAEAQDGEGT